MVKVTATVKSFEGEEVRMAIFSKSELENPVAGQIETALERSGLRAFEDRVWWGGEPQVLVLSKVVVVRQMCGVKEF